MTLIFNFDGEISEELGEEAAVINELAFRFNNLEGQIDLVERAEGLNGVITVLRKYLQKYPKSDGLKEWIATLIGAAIAAIEKAGLEVTNSRPRQQKTPNRSLVMPMTVLIK